MRGAGLDGYSPTVGHCGASALAPNAVAARTAVPTSTDFPSHTISSAFEEPCSGNMISELSAGSSTGPFDRDRGVPALIALPAPQPSFRGGKARDAVRGTAADALDLSCRLGCRACDRRGRGDPVKDLETELAAEEGRLRGVRPAV